MTFCIGVVAFSNRTRISCFERKESISLRRGSGQPCFDIRSRSRRLSSASNALCISMVTIVTWSPAARAASELWIKAATRSMADRRESAFLYCGLSSLKMRVIYAILFAIILFSFLKMQKNRAIGLQNLIDILSFLFIFGSIAISASFQLCEKWLSARQRLYSI